MFGNKRKTGLIFLGYIVTFFIGILVVTAITNDDNFLVFYQPLFTFGVIGFLTLVLIHDISRLREPLSENSTAKLESMSGIESSSIVGFAGLILKARIGMVAVAILFVFPEFAKAVWRMVKYLTD